MILAPSGPSCPAAGQAKLAHLVLQASGYLARAGPPHNRRRSCFRTSYSSLQLTSSMLHPVHLGSQNLADGMRRGREGTEGVRRSFRSGYEGVVFRLIIDAHSRAGAGGEDLPDWNGTQPSPTQISRLPVPVRWKSRDGRRSRDGMLGQGVFFSSFSAGSRWTASQLGPALAPLVASCRLVHRQLGQSIRLDRIKKSPSRQAPHPRTS